MKQPAKIRQSLEILDIAGAQRKNALGLVLTFQNTETHQKASIAELKSGIEHFIEREEHIKNFLKFQAPPLLCASTSILEEHILIESKTSQIMSELALVTEGVTSKNLIPSKLSTIELLATDPFQAALDNRLKLLTSLTQELSQERSLQYLMIGYGLLLIAGVSGVMLFSARAKSSKQTLALLLKRNAQMETVEEVSRVGYWEVDLVNQKPMWSKQTRLIHEVDDDFEPDLETAIEFYAPEYREQVSVAVQDAMKTGNEWDLELEIISAKGNRRWVRAKGRPVRRDGTLVSLVGSFQDISETKSRELELSNALHQKNTALAEVTDLTNAIHSAAIVSIADSEGKILQVNDKFTEISGYDAAEVLGHDHSILNSGHHGHDVFSDLWSTIRSGKVWRGELCNKTKSGEIYWVDTTIYPIMGEDGSPQRFMSIRFDITKRIQASKMATNYFDVSLAPNCIVDKNGMFIKVNKAFCRMLELPHSDIEGRYFSDFVCEKDLSASIEELEKLNRGGETVGFRNSYKISSGESRVIEWQARQFDTLVFASARDISSVVQQEEALLAARQSAEDASNTKSAFLANMSHEIRTPLNGIIGVADVLGHGNGLTSEQQDMVAMISDSGRVLEKILSDILDFSKIEAGKLSIEKAPFDLEDEVRAALDLHIIDAEVKGIEFQLQFDLSTEEKIVGDSLRLRQILSNLASNAVKYTENGCIATHAKLFQETGVWYLNFSIKDTGIGFPEATQGKIFERFDQKRTSDARHFGGTGLGLAISASLAELMKGTLEVDSQPGAGTKFELLLPLEIASTEHQTERDHVAAAEGQELIKGLDILVAEDIKVNQKVLKLLLSPMGCKITFANNGLEALNLFRNNNYDVIFLDMMMPQMGGLEAAREIRKVEAEGHLRRTPIAMLSANAMREHVESSIQSGCDLHISKPVNRNSLISGVRMLLGKVD